MGGSWHAAVALSAGVGGPRRARRAAVARLRMQAQVLADCKVGAAHSLAALASAFACITQVPVPVPAPVLVVAVAWCAGWVLLRLLLLSLLPLLLLVASS